MGECGGPPPRVPPTHLSTIANPAGDLIFRGFVGGQMLSVLCSGPFGTKLTSSATIAHALSIGSVSASLVEGLRKLDLTFSTSNNQISGTAIFLKAWCPGMTIVVSTSIKEGASDVAIKVVVYRGGIQQPHCGAIHSSTKAILKHMWVLVSVIYLRGNSELEGRMCETLVKWKDTGTAAGPLQYSPYSQCYVWACCCNELKNLSQAPSVGFSFQVLSNS